jgi:hypothetical protein
LLEYEGRLPAHFARLVVQAGEGKGYELGVFDRGRIEGHSALCGPERELILGPAQRAVRTSTPERLELGVEIFGFGESSDFITALERTG